MNPFPPQSIHPFLLLQNFLTAQEPMLSDQLDGRTDTCLIEQVGSNVKIKTEQGRSLLCRLPASQRRIRSM